MFEYPKLLKELDNVYILTYLFKGSDMRCWLDLNKMDYKYLDNESFGLMSEKDIKADIRKKLEILTNRSLASKKQQRGTLSSTWYKNVWNNQNVQRYATFMCCPTKSKSWWSVLDYVQRFKLLCRVQGTQKVLVKICLFCLNEYSCYKQVRWLLVVYVCNQPLQEPYGSWVP